MFGWITNLFTNSKDEVMDVARGVGGWIDEQAFTDEEKSVAAFKLLDHQLKWLNATQGMNTARRYLAIMFCTTFILLLVVCVGAVITGTVMDKEMKPMVDSIVAIADTFKLGWIVVTMIVFYFGKGIAENVALGKK
jgi:hypothetical protein